MKQQLVILFWALFLGVLSACTANTVSPDQFESDSAENVVDATVTPFTNTPTPLQGTGGSTPLSTTTPLPLIISTPTPAPTKTPTSTPIATLEEAFVSVTNGPFTLISTSSQGNYADGDSFDPAMSADGRFVVFASQATNLVPDDTNGFADVFLHDVETGETVLISQSTAGEQGTGRSTSPDISADGRFVVFNSESWNMVDIDDKNFSSNIYLHDRETGETTLVTAPVPGSNLGGWDTRCPVISANGRFIAYLSTAPNLVEQYISGETERTWDDFQVFVHDREHNTTQLVSISATGEAANADTECPQISEDGSKIVFRSEASNLAEHKILTGLFLYDSSTRKTSLIAEYSIEQSDFTIPSEFSMGEGMVTFTDGTHLSSRILVIHFDGTIEQTYEIDGEVFQPNITPDGQYLTFWIGERGGAGLYTVLSWTLYRYHLETGVFDTILSTTDGSGITPFEGDPGEVTRTPSTGQIFTLNASAGKDVKSSPIISQDGQSIAFRSVRPDIVPIADEAVGSVNIFVFRVP